MKQHGISILALWLMVAPLAHTTPNSIEKSRHEAARSHPNINRQSIPSSLGWVADKHSGVCEGYYVEPVIGGSFLPGKMDQLGPVHLSADHSEYSATGDAHFTGNVTIEQGIRQLGADDILLQRNANGVFDRAQLKGQVSVREPGKLFLSDFADLDLNGHRVHLEQVLYRLTLDTSVAKNTFNLVPAEDIVAADTDLDEQQAQPERKLTRLTAWGSAGTVDQPEAKRIHLYKATYSTCPPKKPAWQLQAEQLDLDRVKGRGHARQIKLRMNDVPILYFPYFNFPVDNRRASGFLFPSIGYASDAGTDIQLPYYFNMAPNYDLTLLPRYLTQRGAMLGGTFRYLTENDQGELKASFLPNDRAFSEFKKSALQDFIDKPLLLPRLESESSDRGYFHFRDRTRFNEHWRFSTEFNWVSDDYYFQNLGGNLADISNNQLERRADIQYDGQYWRFIGRVQKYQTLHPINQAPIQELYAREPQLILQGEFPDLLHDTDVHWQSEWVNFTINRNPGEDKHMPQGQRLYLQGGLSHREEIAGGYIMPSMYLQSVIYSLHSMHHEMEEHDDPTHASRLLPILNLDAGMQFSRTVHAVGRDYTQTLEPRLYYLFVPFVNQDDLPVFDTTIQPFNFEHLFRLNRFDGFDRMNDANQLSVGVITRFIDQQTGEEKLRLGLGQIMYFRHRNVQLCNTHDCSDEDDPTLVAVTTTRNVFSPMVAEVFYQLDPAWSVRSQLALNLGEHAVNNGNLYWQYQPKPQHLFNVGYVFIRDGDELFPGSKNKNLSQSDISFAFPLSEQWSILGRWNYNLSHHYLQTYLAGIQYDSCCWAFRVVASRIYKSLDERNNPQYDQVYYLQWLLKGLGSIGSGNPSSLLTQGISNYRDPFKV